MFTKISPGFFCFFSLDVLVVQLPQGTSVAANTSLSLTFNNKTLEGYVSAPSASRNSPSADNDSSNGSGFIMIAIGAGVGLVVLLAIVVVVVVVMARRKRVAAMPASLKEVPKMLEMSNVIADIIATQRTESMNSSTYNFSNSNNNNINSNSNNDFDFDNSHRNSNRRTGYPAASTTLGGSRRAAAPIDGEDEIVFSANPRWMSTDQQDEGETQL